MRIQSIHKVDATYLDGLWRDDDIVTEQDALLDQYGSGDTWMQELPVVCPARCADGLKDIEQLYDSCGNVLHAEVKCPTCGGVGTVSPERYDELTMRSAGVAA